MYRSRSAKTLFMTLIVSSMLLVTAAMSQVHQQNRSSTTAGAAMRMSADNIIANWPAKPQEVARMVIARYGQPNETTASMLIWNNNGPWTRTIVYREEVPHSFPMPHPDLLEQFIDYRVPTARFSALAAYDGSVIVERTKGEMSARCDKEEMNILALNLAHDIVTGKRSVEDARRFYAETAMAFMRGQRPPYTQRLQFEASRSGTADPDTPAKMR